MSFPQKSYLSPERKSWDNNESMIKSVLLNSEKKQTQSNKKIPKTQFKDCFYHNKPIKFLCISQNCQNKYYTLCDHPQCNAMHSHPNLNVIQVQKFEEFKITHLKSINLLKSRIRKYEKEVIQNIVHKITKDFQLVRNAIDAFYIHKAAKKISEGKLDQLTPKQLNQFVQKSILIAEQQSFSNLEITQQSRLRDIEQSLESTFIESKNLIISTIENIEQSITKITQTDEYKVLTLQDCILNRDGSSSPGKSLIKKETFSSKILQFQEEYFTILKMLKENRFSNFKEFKFLYRASENDYTAAKYHQAVDGKSPILLIIMAETGMKFGAFINCKTSQSNDWISDPTGLSFIFSLDHNQSYRLMSSANHRTRAVFGGSKGPQIGAGCDIYISDHCNQNTQSGSNFGGSYQLPFGVEFGTKKARGYLAGKQNFSVSQYEAFLLL